MGRFALELEMANSVDVANVERGLLALEQVRRAAVRGVVDTGATRLVIPASVAEQLGGREAGQTQVRYADGHIATRTLMDDIQVELLGRRGTFRAAVEPDRTSALIGAIVLEDLDLIVDRAKQTLSPRDPRQIISEIE